MRKLLFLLLLCALPTSGASRSEQFFKPETADDIRDGYRPTSIWWNTWKVSSSEELWSGRRLSGFPLTYLFDGNPRTTWAHSSNSQKAQWQHGGWRNRFALHMRTEVPVTTDALWIMNGDNRRPDLFRRNDRVIEMEIWVNDKRLKMVRLSDTMGWHKISLPRRKVQEIGLVMSGIRKGNGPDNDVCLSELALYDRGQKINMKMPQAVLFEDGNESGDAPLDCALIARDGKVITQGTLATSGQQEEEWSPDQSYVCGLWMDPKKYTRPYLFWVADTRAQKVTKRLYLPRQSNVDLYTNDLKWVGNKAVEVRWLKPDWQDDEDEKDIVAHRKIYSVN